MLVEQRVKQGMCMWENLGSQEQEGRGRKQKEHRTGRSIVTSHNFYSLFMALG